jgi:hypothetical protein
VHGSGGKQQQVVAAKLSGKKSIANFNLGNYYLHHKTQTFHRLFTDFSAVAAKLSGNFFSGKSLQL